MIKIISNNRILLVFVVPFILGCLTVFSFQPFNFSFINFFVLPCLFLILSNINKRSRNKYRKKPYLRNLFYVGYFFGIGFFLSGTHWISNSLEFDDTFKSLVPVTIILIPIVLGLFFGFVSLITGPFLKLDLKSILLFALSLSLIDYLRSILFTGFPWNLWAYSWSWFTEILQILNPIGLFAYNLITITFFLLPCVFFVKTNFKNLSYIFIGLLIFFLNYIYGNYVINKNTLLVKETILQDNFINLKIISPNFDLKYNLNERELDERFNKLIRYSNPEKDKKTLFVWPEGALSGKYFYELEKYKKKINQNFSKNHEIVLGINTLDNSSNFFNSLIIVDHNFNKIFRYNKIKLVPFGEFLPLEKFFSKLGLKKITEGFGSFKNGKESKTYKYTNINIIPLICYEIIFPELLQGFKPGNNIIINISEDAWFGNSIGPYQHFSKTVFRAIESNSYIVRSANKGISAIVDNTGKIVKSLKINETGNLEYKMPIIKNNNKNKNDLIFFVLLFTYILIFLLLKKNDK